MRKTILLVTLALIASACNLQVAKERSGFDLLFAETILPDPGSRECAWAWASQPLPEISANLQAALTTANLSNVTASATAFGENCISQDGNIVRFAIMQVDFYFEVQVENLTDSNALGGILGQILDLLETFPPGSFPGPQQGEIGVDFIQDSQSHRLWFPLSDGLTARLQGLHGAPLLDALDGH